MLMISENIDVIDQEKSQMMFARVSALGNSSSKQKFSRTKEECTYPIICGDL
jgi:hypothetical protein